MNFLLVGIYLGIEEFPREIHFVFAAAAATAAAGA